MSLLERVIQSKLLKFLGPLLALVALITVLSNALVSPQPIIRGLSIGYIVLFGLCVVVVGLDYVGRKALAYLGHEIAKGVVVQAPAEPAPQLQQVEACSDEKAYQYWARRYGMAYGDLVVECSVRADGSGEVLRRVEVEAHSQIEKLDTFMRIPEKPPEGKAWHIAQDTVQCLTPNHDIVILRQDVFQGDGVLSVLMTIKPPLIENQQLQYEMTELLPPGLYAVDLTEEQKAARQMDHDYFGWTINRPTRTLKLRVYFPARSRPTDPWLEVCYASAAPGIPHKLLQLLEQGRHVLPPLGEPEGGRCKLEWVVHYPIIGLIYRLCWHPLETERRPGRKPK